ncbi:5-demethoxyubiquinone hydroxylase, mitochondrial isoform X2 [Cephus cinctus]|nr:5-demethoxyubiquinone hydroxylase, mitochondrial isoform X2 [Cephus cinctus]XP_015587343.1 5-demethoxyubiquinone hydroxylase, mitochondrial isoform X2 [Cephus cinctus]
MLTIERSVRYASTFPQVRLNPKAKKLIHPMIRVNHAGELAADRIYAGQMAILGKTSVGPTIQHMWDQEKKHREKFEELIKKYRVRPSFFVPLWEVTAFAMGAVTSLMGQRAAMACTVAVETVIVEHYNEQLRVLQSLEKTEGIEEIMEVIKTFRDEEQEHHDTGIENEAERAPFYDMLSFLIRSACKVGITTAVAL